MNTVEDLDKFMNKSSPKSLNTVDDLDSFLSGGKLDLTPTGNLSQLLNENPSPGENNLAMLNKLEEKPAESSGLLPSISNNYKMLGNNIASMANKYILDPIGALQRGTANALKESKVLYNPKPVTEVNGELYPVVKPINTQTPLDRLKAAGQAFKKGFLGEERPQALEAFAPRADIKRSESKMPLATGIAEIQANLVTDPLTYGPGAISQFGKVAELSNTEKSMRSIAELNKKLLSNTIPAAEGVQKSLKPLTTVDNVNNKTLIPKIEPETVKPVSTQLDDISGFDAYTNDVERIFKKVYGDDFETAKEKYLTPFNEAKKNNQLMQQEIVGSLKNDIVDKFGFKKGSKESAAVQWFGEGKKLVGTEKVLDPQTNKMVKVPKLEDYTLQDLKREFPSNWENIVEADSWFRNVYDKTIDKINESRKTIYGDVQAKVNAVNNEISKISETLDQKTLERFGLEQGRPYKTGKEIDISSQIKTLQKRMGTLTNRLSDSKLQQGTKDLLTDKISNLEKRIEIKKDQLGKANLYGQPTAKQFDVSDKQIKRLEGLLQNKKELVESDQLWRGKFVPKRKDYYRHFRELSEGIEGLKNLFDTPAQINPSLAGISDFTNPKSKFLSLAQRRGLGSYKADAVGGLLDYAKSASYATHIDPQIQNFRNLATDLSKETEDTRNLNHFIEYLNDFADNLSGKTNPFDRPIQKVIGRETMNIANWANGRIKSNTVLGNASSSIAQLANIPNGIAYVKNPKYLGQGMIDTLASIKNKNNPMKESGFLMERYGDKLYSQFDTNILQQPKKFAAWLLGVGDEIGTKFIWNSTYRQALDKGIKNPIQHADDVTRSLVAGRGIGEVPLIQQSKVFQIAAPFQLEVANLWRVMGDRVKEKDFGGLAILLISNYLFNRAAEQIKGSGVTFDPIKAVQDAFTEKDTTLLQKAGRLGGEILGNVPLGSTIAAQLPEDIRKKYLGKEDPTRYGTGLVLTKGIQDPFYKLLPSFGGGQIKKTVEGIGAVNKGGEYSINEKGEKSLKYPIEGNLQNKIQSFVFGKSALPESQRYYNDNLKPLSTEQTKSYEYAKEKGLDKNNIYHQLQIIRKLEPLPGKEGVSDKQKNEAIDKSSMAPSEKSLLKDLFVKGFKPDSSFTFEKKEYKLLPGEYETFRSISEDTYNKVFGKINKEQFNRSPDDIKTKILQDISEKANEVAKVQILRQRGLIK